MRASWKIWLNYGLGPILFAVLSWSLYQQIRQRPNLEESWNAIRTNLFSPGMIVIAAMMLVNWGIESRKWQWLVNRVQPFGWWRAFQSVLSGCSVTMLTPNRIGEYGGRVLYVEEGNRIAAVSLTIVGSISQLLITIWMGCVGVFYLILFNKSEATSVHILPVLWTDVLLVMSVAGALLLTGFYFRISWLVQLLERQPRLERWLKHIRVLEALDTTLLWRLLWLSLLRYFVFMVQYLLMLWLMDVQVPPVLGFWLLALFYLVMAIAPTFGFVELPVRISASWLIFSFTENELGVGAAALAIWLVNLVVPAIIGSLLILRVRIWKT